MKPMRLDKYLSLAGIASRTETSKAVRGGEVLVDGVPAKKADMQVDPDAVKALDVDVLVGTSGREEFLLQLEQMRRENLQLKVEMQHLRNSK